MSTRSDRARRACAALLLALLWVPLRQSGAGEEGGVPAPQRLEGRLADGALWRAQVPTAWNGTLLLYSHGYTAQVQLPALAPRGVDTWLLAHGYALAASSYARGGWAVAEAVPDQRQVLAAFITRVGRPRRILAWGDSMGGLITTQLVETPGTGIDGGLSACGSIAGTLAMMNTALDGAFAFTTLQAPEAGIELVAVHDDRANAQRVQAAVTQALDSPAGRARLALAGVLGGLPGWTDERVAQPPNDPHLQLLQLAQAVPMGLFPPRVDQEQRAGGVLSWNTGVDYRALLQRSGRRSWVAQFYREAHLSLEADLQQLAAAPRIQALPTASHYMLWHYAPTARPFVPFLTLHTVGDGLTSEVLQSGYGEAALRGSDAARYQAVTVNGAGHCRFSAAEYLAALQTLEARVQEGHWRAAPATLNQRARALDLGAARFVRHTSAPLLRACWGETGHCPGLPGRRSAPDTP